MKIILLFVFISIWLSLKVNDESNHQLPLYNSDWVSWIDNKDTKWWMEKDIILSGRWCSQTDTEGVWRGSNDNLCFDSQKGKLQCPDDYATWGVTSKDFKNYYDSSNFYSSSIPIGTTCKYEVEFSYSAKVSKAIVNLSKWEYRKDKDLWNIKHFLNSHSIFLETKSTKLDWDLYYIF